MIFKQGYLYIRSKGHKVIIMLCFEGCIIEYFNISIYRSCTKFGQLEKKDRHSYSVIFEKELRYLNALLSLMLKDIEGLKAEGGGK